MAEITDEWIKQTLLDSIAYLEEHGSPCGCRGAYQCTYHEGMEAGLDCAQDRARELPPYAGPMKAGWPDRPITWNDSALQRWIETGED